MAHCASGESCVWLLESYLKDSVGGSVKDYVSLAFGLISVFSWAVAEIPQIFTNFMSGSTEGVSLVFLMTNWLWGIYSMLLGVCWNQRLQESMAFLDSNVNHRKVNGGLLLNHFTPALIPTQFYTALVYTITTVVLVGQTVYYDHIRKWLKGRKAKSSPEKEQDCASKDWSTEHTGPVKIPESIDYFTKLAKTEDADILKKLFNGTPASSLTIPTISLAPDGSNGINLYSTSARSLASSHTPTPGSYLVASYRGSARSGPSYMLNESSVDDEGLLANIDSTSPKKSKTMLRSVAAAVFFVGGFNYFYLQTIPRFDSIKIDGRASIVLTGRKILQEASIIALRESVIDEQSTSRVGTWLGWIMAAIYMGGRLPQIWKNGLNPLMFLFIVIGNAAYVGSIIVKTLEWKKLKPNMPWLVDAAVCVLLDCFILGQFIYYYKIRKPAEDGDNNGNYEKIEQ